MFKRLSAQLTLVLKKIIKCFDKMNSENYAFLNDIDSYKFGWFEPPSLEKTLLLYGLHGGAQWPGGVFDPYSNNLFIPVNHIPWKIRLFISSDEEYPKNLKKEYNLYAKNCSSCHGVSRKGYYEYESKKN